MLFINVIIILLDKMLEGNEFNISLLFSTKIIYF